MSYFLRGERKRVSDAYKATFGTGGCFCIDCNWYKEKCDNYGNSVRKCMCPTCMYYDKKRNGDDNACRYFIEFKSIVPPGYMQE